MNSTVSQHPPLSDVTTNIHKRSFQSQEEYQKITHHVYYANQSNPNHYKQKIKKKTGNNCYTLNLLKTNGNLHLFHNNEKLYFCKLRMVDFDDHFDELLEKGKANLGNYFNQEPNTIPEITFWQQRYYYYSKYDEGIQMDNECWWSVTPEIIAEYIAKIAGPSAVVIDGFCGSGGNVIQFSKFCKKIYAIDIDKPRLDICRNNCKVYNCKDNIEYILSDFLLMENSPIFSNNKADYIFLSPPWGGVKYKSSDVYSIKNLMTPSIFDIVRVSLNVSKKIMFYLPRTLLLEELFDILSDIMNKNSDGSGDRIFFDVHILKSANKIKAQLIIFGNDIGNSIKEEELTEYLEFRYQNITERSLKILNAIAKIVGNFKFLQTETFLRKNSQCEMKEDFPSAIIKYFFTKILSEQEKIKLKSLNILNSKHKIKKGVESLPKNYIENSKHSHSSNNSKTQNNLSFHDTNSSENHSTRTTSSNGSRGQLLLKPTWNLEMKNEITFEYLSV